MVRSAGLVLLLGSLISAGGCVLAGDAGVFTQPTLEPKGGSVTGRLAMGGGGTSTSENLLSIGIDTRVDVASGGSRWTAGASALGGIRIAKPCFLTGRVGLWKAIVSGADEASVVPTFELGGYVPLEERFDAKHPEHGASNEGVVFGVGEDLDHANYFTVFVGYALFIAPGI
ncbi:MAG: hypothetical protein ABJE66_32930 [Deltaproteobacteria bacterium]